MTPFLMIDNSPIAALLTDPRMPDNPIIRCNTAFLDLTGYTLKDVIGRNCRFLKGPETSPESSRAIGAAISKRQPIMTEILNYRKDGSAFRNAVMIVPIFSPSGEPEYFLGSMVAIEESNVAPRCPAARAQVAALTPRQQRILTEMAAGKLNKQIAFELGLSERTVKMHRAAVLTALGVHSSADAIRIAVEAGY